MAHRGVRRSTGGDTRIAPARIRTTGWAALVALQLLLPAVATSQLPVATPSFHGLGGSGMAVLRGAGAVAGNPAALALPSNPRWSLALPSASLLVGLEPVTGADLRRWGGRRLPEAERERWLDRIADEGEQRGRAGGELTGLAFTTGFVGFQAGTVATAGTLLNPDAAELLLFGNAGRTGTPGDFELAGSSLDLAVYSTAAAVVALPMPFRLGGERDQAAALAVTVKYTEGNVLILGRDAGSILEGDPVAVDLRFPVVQSDTTGRNLRNGAGFGVDLGAAWEGGPWMVALHLENLFHTFAWDAEKLVYRAGEALFNGGETSSDFDPIPFQQAPPGFRALVEELRFRPQLGVGMAWRRDPSTLLTAAWRERLGGGIRTGPARVVSVGVEHTGSPSFPLRAGAALITDGWQLSGGAGVRIGGAELQGSGVLQRGRVGPATQVALGLVFTGR